jgi:hypothetical protein
MGLEGDYWGISGGYAEWLGKFWLSTLLRQDPPKDAAAEVTRLWNGQSDHRLRRFHGWEREDAFIRVICEIRG